MKKVKLEYRYYDTIEKIDKKIILTCAKDPDEDGMLKVYSFEGNPDRIIQEFSTANLMGGQLPLSVDHVRFFYICHTLGLLNWYGWGKMVDDALYVSVQILNEQLMSGIIQCVDEFEDDNEDVQYYQEQFDVNGTVLQKEEVPTEEEKKNEED